MKLTKTQRRKVMSIISENTNGTGIHEYYEGEDKGWDSIDCMTCWGKPDERFK